MATVRQTRKGPTIDFEAAERVELAAKMRAAMAERQYGIKDAARETTLSPNTIRMRVRDDGKRAPVSMYLWVFIALCDGLGLPPIETAADLGFSLSDDELKKRSHPVSDRREWKSTFGPTDPSTPVLAPRDGASSGPTTDVDQMIEEAADRILRERIDAAVRRRLGGS